MDINILLARAQIKHGIVTPLWDNSADKYRSWQECIAEGYFWFNDCDGSTHIISVEESNEN
jgi:hypothetical protein